MALSAAVNEKINKDEGRLLAQQRKFDKIKATRIRKASRRPVRSNEYEWDCSTLDLLTMYKPYIKTDPP
jgi:hypothetical protein